MQDCAGRLIRKGRRLIMFYENNWESLNSRPVPAWFGEAKFGIFIHWGIYSVPAFTKRGRYAEWYGRHLEDPASEDRAFHDRVYGPKTAYADLVRDFRAELFDADEWAELFRDSGAKYMNLVSKHHDGFCMYQTDLMPYWNSVDVGPHRDFAAELKAACEKTDVRFGVYHSVYEWWNPIYRRDPEEYALKHLIPMLKELVERYQPNTLFTDGEWDQPSSVWHSTEFLQWLYNESSVRDFIVPNDRWGKETRGALGGNFTTEYGNIGNGRTLADVPDHRPFEECRGIGRSFGFNRAEKAEDYESVGSLLKLLCSLVSKGGNLLLNIGPAADGTIPVVMQERLLGMGQWLKVNGEAIYGSEVYTREDTGDVYYTRQRGSDGKDTIYAITSEYPAGRHSFPAIPYSEGKKVSLLGCGAPVKVWNDNGALGVEAPFVIPSELGCTDLYTFRVE